jgi:hypothetical protein
MRHPAQKAMLTFISRCCGLGLVLILHFFTFPAQLLACVVGIGTAESCTEAAFDACLPAGGSFDGYVTFDCGGSATIAVSSKKAIATDTTIDGGGHITISGGNTVGILAVKGGAILDLANLTLSAGKELNGGAIYNPHGGTVTVSNSVFLGNVANGDFGGAISNGGALMVANSTFSGNTVTGNHAAGGAIANISANSASGGGGAIYNAYGTLTVTNCTFSDNHALVGGAITNQGATTSVTNSTIVGNGTALSNEHGYTLTVRNSILANSAAGGNCFVFPTAGPITDGGYNIEDDATCNFSAANDSLSNTNPNLDPAGLANNGGPTQTVALCTGEGVPAGCAEASPAINAGNQSVCAATGGAAAVNNLDQRGFVRPGAGAMACSIGAFEADASPSTNTPTPTPTAIPTPSTPIPPGGPCIVGAGTSASCTEAALHACLPGGRNFKGTVRFDCGGSATIKVTSTKTISADTSIDGGALITIDGGNGVGVFDLGGGVTLSLARITIRGSSGFFGGAVGNSGGTVKASEVAFVSNVASYGGAIYNGFGGIVEVSNSRFIGNGHNAIFNYYATMGVTSSTFSGNDFVSVSAAIYNGYGTLTVTNSTFSGDGAPLGGGAIDNEGATLTLANSTFSGIVVGAGGGAVIYNSTGTATVRNCTFFGNTVIAGAALYNDLGILTLANTIVANTGSGGNCDAFGATGITDGGHNIDDGTTCEFSEGNGSLSNTDPLLDPAGLADNAGLTQTIALLPGSPAIGAGDQSICGAPPVDNVDQRGYSRPGKDGINCSIGAYEYNSLGPPPTCVGDCGNTAQVTVNELLTLVNVALGSTAITTCEAGDANHDGQITVDEILTAVSNALNGCPSR